MGSWQQLEKEKVKRKKVKGEDQALSSHGSKLSHGLDCGLEIKVLQTFVWLTCHIRCVSFTTKITKDTKGSDD